MSYRWLLYPLAGIGLFAAWLLLGYFPDERERRRLETDISSAEWELADFNRIVGELPKYLATYEDLSLQRQHLASSLYAKQDILDLFRQLGTAATEHNLKLLEISPPVDELLALNRTNPNSNEPQFLNITMGLRGTYVDCGRFVSDLEQATYVRGVNRCYVRGQQEPQPQVDCTVSFRALIKSSGEAS